MRIPPKRGGYTGSTHAELKALELEKQALSRKQTEEILRAHIAQKKDIPLMHCIKGNQHKQNAVLQTSPQGN